MEKFRVNGVAVLDEHLPGPRPEGYVGGWFPAHFGEKDLRRAADATNALYEDTGDWPMVVIRHNRRDNPDPLVIGHAENFRVADIGNRHRRKCLFCDFVIDSQYRHLFNSHPRRSVEIMADTYVVDPIALLGGEAPERYLGLHHYQRGDPVAFPAIADTDTEENEENDMSEKEILDYVLKAVMATPQFAFLDQLMAEKGGATNGGEAEGSTNDSAQYNANAPSGTGTFVPGAAGADADADDPNKTNDKGAMAMQPNMKAAQYAADLAKKVDTTSRIEALEAALAEQQKAVAHYQRQTKLAERTLAFSELAKKGVKLEPTEEAAFSIDFDDAAFKRYLDRVAAKYQRAPINRAGPIAAMVPPPPDAAKSEAEVLADMRQAVAEGVRKQLAQNGAATGAGR
jgi:hypothetical protein